MATHPHILAWRIPWTEEPGRLGSMQQSMGSESDATENTQPISCYFFQLLVEFLISAVDFQLNIISKYSTDDCL